jgi:hypothetical protein
MLAKRPVTIDAFGINTPNTRLKNELGAGGPSGDSL